MPGIVFFKTRVLEQIVQFYVNRINMDVWLKQADCTILQKENLLVGFCQRDSAETEGMLTFFYETREEVDDAFSRLSDIATEEPSENQKYKIYQFFATDPEGRALEFQAFLHSVDIP